MQNIAKTNQVAVVSTVAEGGVPASYSLGFGNSVPSSAFKPAAGGVPVILSDLRAYTSNAGDRGIQVLATSAEGHSQVFIALAKGFPGGQGSASSGAFLAAVQEAVASELPVFLAVAGNSGRHFCALSPSPFGGVTAEEPSDQILF